MASEMDWEDERAQLMEDLTRVNQIALESQAEAAVYLKLLKNCNEAARQARDSGDISHLNSVDGNIVFYATPREDGSDEWGKYFLDAYIRDAGWLEDTKKALEQIKADAEKLSVEGDETNAELKRKIIAAAEKGLILHL